MSKYFKSMVAVMTLFAFAQVKAADTNRPTATLIFSGITNAPSGTVASFILTNGTPANIACGPEAIEYQTNNVWQKLQLAGRNFRITRRWIGVPEELDAGQSASFAIPPPYTNCPWRLVFVCQEKRLFADNIADAFRHITATNAANRSTRQFSGRHYSIVSPEVTIQPRSPSR